MFSKRFNLTISNRIPAYKKIIEVDSDKSISIRSFLISAISQNKSIIKNVLESEDVLSTIVCLKKLGIKISFIKNEKFKNTYKNNNLFLPRKNISELLLK